MNSILPAACLLLLSLFVSPPAAAGADERPTYGVLYSAWIKPGKSTATVRIRLSRHPEWVKWMRLSAKASRYTKFKGTGGIEVKGDTVTWTPPKKDAWLQYQVDLSSRRESGRYDGYFTENWALFRADDLVPPIRLDMEDGTESRSKLDLHLPEGWSSATPFARYTSGRLKIDNPRRLFDRPTGWMVLGKIGTRRETIGPTRVTVAAPEKQGVRRMDMLAFLHWTLPTLQSLLPSSPERLLVVSAGDPMWRGALSAPSSLYVHADRPMISENSTSTLIHELVHVFMSARGAPGADWIVEGLAEYYSLEVLLRSGAISRRRFDKAQADLAEWAKDAGPLDAARSTGPTTAKAVGILRRVDEEIRRSSGERRSLDDVLRGLAAEEGPVTVARFRALAEEAAGRSLRSIPD